MKELVITLLILVKGGELENKNSYLRIMLYVVSEERGNDREKDYII